MDTKRQTIVVIGLGYVGLPLVVEFSKYFQVIGFDTNEKRVKELNACMDVTKELTSDDLHECISERGAQITYEELTITGKDFYIVCVPTPVDDRFEPDLTAVKLASMLVGRVIKRGGTVIYESTVYPGATEEDCIPLVAAASGLKRTEDFYFGYSPERINPGDRNSSITGVVKVTSGCCEKSSLMIDELYGKIVTAGTYRAKSIRVAEASKVFENVQRDVNIALVNEFSMLCHALSIDTQDVLKASSTKWNFMPFSPGLVGGHCIGIDPYYLIHKAKTVGYNLDITMQARKINESMPYFIVQQLKDHLLLRDSPARNCKVLIMGYTFKENCPDTRNTKVKEVVNELTKLACKIHVYDPWVDSSELNIHGVNFIDSIGLESYDAVIVAVKHKIFVDYDSSEWARILKNKPIFFDLKNCCPYFDSNFTL